MNQKTTGFSSLIFFFPFFLFFFWFLFCFPSLSLLFYFHAPLTQLLLFSPFFFFFLLFLSSFSLLLVVCLNRWGVSQPHPPTPHLPSSSSNLPAVASHAACHVAGQVPCHMDTCSSNFTVFFEEHEIPIVSEFNDI